MERDYAQKDKFLYLNELKDEICKKLFKYEYKTKIDGINTFGDLIREIDSEIINLSILKLKKPETITSKVECIVNPINIFWDESNVISEKNNYFKGAIHFNFDGNVILEPPNHPIINLSIRVLK